MVVISWRYSVAGEEVEWVSEGSMLLGNRHLVQLGWFWGHSLLGTKAQTI